MLSVLARFLLVASSLSPLLGAVAVNQIAHDAPVGSWGVWFGVALVLIGVCWAMLRYAAANSQTQLLKISAFERDDKEMLAYLVTYLLPFLSTDKLGFTGEWMTGAYVLAVIFLVITHSGAFHFNPVMGLLGYHFHAIKDEDGVSSLLISRALLRHSDREVDTVRLAPSIYLRRESQTC